MSDGSASKKISGPSGAWRLLVVTGPLSTITVGDVGLFTSSSPDHLASHRDEHVDVGDFGIGDRLVLGVGTLM
jgi:hypothetical protein